jgi:hypothetical protein
MTHEQKKIHNKFFGTDIEVDAGISDVIKALWDNDINTIMSCEESVPTWMSITFELSEFEKLLKLGNSKIEYDEFRRLLPRMHGGSPYPEQYLPEWSFKFVLFYELLVVTVYIPKSDYDGLLAMLTRDKK